MERITLYKKTADGSMHQKTISRQKGHSYIRVFTCVGTEMYEEEIESNDTQTEELLAEVFNQLVREGWDTDRDVADASMTTIDWDNFPPEFAFGKMLQNPDARKLGEGPFRYWAAIRGEPLYVLIGKVARAYGRDGKSRNIDPRILCECEKTYPTRTLLRGVLRGPFFVWDVPFCEGRDRISFESFSAREPFHKGQYVRAHQEILPSGVQPYIVVDCKAEAGGTAYAWRAPAPFMRGAWLHRPTL